MTTVVYHSADFDGIFCREIAKKFLGEQDVQYIGWNFGDKEMYVPQSERIYVMDLPVDKVFGLDFSKSGPDVNEVTGSEIRDLVKLAYTELVWIDHHKSSIGSHPAEIKGYRIDGVAACRLAWQWFTIVDGNAKRDPNEIGLAIRPAGVLPMVQHFKSREVNEPLAVRLAGEYDVWDHRGDGDLEFQYGLRVLPKDCADWQVMLKPGVGEKVVQEIIEWGNTCLDYERNMNAMWLKESAHIVVLDGVAFLAQNSVQRGSLILESMDKPETGHDALMLYGFRGRHWTVSMYHASHRKDIDLSKIAVKYGGGGHKGACGFTRKELPFPLGK